MSTLLDWSLRPAQTLDAPALVRLVNSAYRGESGKVGWTTESDLLGGQRTDLEAIERTLADRNSTILLADRLGTVEGCVHLENKGEGLAYLGMLTVAPELQRGGLGRRLVAEAERYVVDKWSASTMEMTVISVRVELIAWYERRGYVRTGERRPFPTGNPRFGLPKRADLEFEVLKKYLAPRAG